MMCYANNIDDEKVLQLEIEYNAQRDGLTGLYNRQTFAKKVNNYIKDNCNLYQYNAYFILDLDNFKTINDQLGHLKGDDVLIDIATILQNVFNENSYLCRYGGDEFIFFLYDQVSYAVIEDKVNKVLEDIRHIEIEMGYQVSASIGICFVGDEKTNKELFKKADEALYECKNNGKNGFRIYKK